MIWGTDPEDRGGRDELLHQIMVQVGKLHLPFLFGSGSARSLISCAHFQQLSRGDPTFQLSSTGVTCVTTSGQSL